MTDAQTYNRPNFRRCSRRQNHTLKPQSWCRTVVQPFAVNANFYESLVSSKAIWKHLCAVCSEFFIFLGQSSFFQERERKQMAASGCFKLVVGADFVILSKLRNIDEVKLTFNFKYVICPWQIFVKRTLIKILYKIVLLND